MKSQLGIATGQCSSKGRKSLNQDFHAIKIPNEPQVSTKGITIALADGISSSDVSQIASETSVKGFLEDYYATPESWTVKTSAQRVLQSTNSWLYAQTRNSPHRYNIDRGYVCTFSALILKSTTAHLFHAGDARIYRAAGNRLEQLTKDHRLWISEEKSFLSRALGMRDWLDMDYQTHAIETGDIFILATDGVHEFIDNNRMLDIIKQNQDNLDQAAEIIVNEALNNGSGDNLTIQIVCIDQLPQHDIYDLHHQASVLPFPPELRPRMVFDGYKIIRAIHASNRSHVYLALDGDTQDRVILKVPSVDMRQDTDYLDRFMMEEWVARRINNIHVLKPMDQFRKRNYLYTVSEYIDGQTLNQWMLDNPNPDLETVRNIIEQIARGLYALHRLEIIHQDLRPSNIMIDRNGTVKLIDFGSVRVAGLIEISGNARSDIPGAVQYAAPEYFVGNVGTIRSDLFSLGVITYQMMTGRLPFGPHVARTNNKAAQNKLVYQSIHENGRGIPSWVDDAIRKSVHPNPHRRYEEISEFVQDLRQPNPVFTNKHRQSLLERNPVTFWKGLSLMLFIILTLMLSTHPMFNH